MRAHILKFVNLNTLLKASPRATYTTSPPISCAELFSDWQAHSTPSAVKHLIHRLDKVTKQLLPDSRIAI
ncbi:MAG: hypothetical protein M1503_00540 [Thaumarchaeota archaeon]|nr:hypothetical protein [Nitrososphaerota archaeon]